MQKPNIEEDFMRNNLYNTKNVRIRNYNASTAQDANGVQASIAIIPSS